MQDIFVKFAETALPILLIILVAFFTLRRVANWYKKISPNTLAVISGRKHKVGGVERGFRYVIGGGTLVIPLLEQMQEMSLNVMQVRAEVKDVPDKNGALVSVVAIANVKIKSDDQSVPLAIERFLGKSPQEIEEIIQNTLEGNLRAIVGKMEINELLRDRQTFMQNVVTEAGEDLGKMGLGVDGAQIQDIRDPRGYIDALGKKKTAEIVRDATVGEAEAKRDADQQSAAARQIGETKKAEADLNISNAQRDRDMGIADNNAKVKARQAVIPIAAEIAAAERQKELNTATVAAEQATVEASIELQSRQKELNEATLDATIVTTATKNKEAKIIDAQAEAQSAEQRGEAVRIKLEKEGLGEQAKQTGIAEGRKQLASAKQAELVADAEGNKASLLAAAAGKEADLVAEGKGQEALAAGRKAMLLAEAEGASAKAKAFKELDDAGRFLMILQALPPVIDSAGDAIAKSVTPLAKAIGEGLGNIDEVRIVDLGAGQGNGGNLLAKFANNPSQLIFQIFEQAKAAGYGPFMEELARKAGFDVTKLGTHAGGAEHVAEPSATSVTAAPAVAPKADTED